VERHGRAQLEAIAAEIEGKTKEEVVAYSKVSGGGGQGGGTGGADSGGRGAGGGGGGPKWGREAPQ
jgi:hypothetical protein